MAWVYRYARKIQITLQLRGIEISKLNHVEGSSFNLRKSLEFHDSR